jgi:hypothetical protein
LTVDTNVSKITEPPIYPFARTGAPFEKGQESVILAGMLLAADGKSQRPHRASYTGQSMTPEQVEAWLKQDLLEWQRAQLAQDDLTE